ncbi:MAG: Phosphoribosylformylglycinamidine cyclo-ligase [Firmicutes bacterium ADurb.Bin419]|nr:MAG: Phosphoribosylformylglycinamidine cyclo-ligase [Firmicutes bacterium ADurb.Bin419]
MAGFYPEDEYDVAGFAVGIVDKCKVINGKSIKAGDTLIGVSSSGIHSNGYSLVRKVLLSGEGNLSEKVESLGTTLGEELLKPTKIYVKTILDLKDKYEIKGICHITGGGFYENMPRMLPEGLGIKVNKGSWPVLPIFDLIQKRGNVSDRDMFNTFNMGIGIAMAVDSKIANEVVNYLNREKKEAYIIGEIVNGKSEVEIC